MKKTMETKTVWLVLTVVALGGFSQTAMAGWYYIGPLTNVYLTKLGSPNLAITNRTSDHGEVHIDFRWTPAAGYPDGYRLERSFYDDHNWEVQKRYHSNESIGDDDVVFQCPGIWYWRITAWRDVPTENGYTRREQSYSNVVCYMGCVPG